MCRSALRSASRIATFGVRVMARAGRQFGAAEQTARLGAAEGADEHRKVGLDPGDVGPKACLAQRTQLLRSRAQFVVFPIDECHSVGGISGTTTSPTTKRP